MRVPAAAPGGALLCIDDLGAALDDGPRMEKLVRILQKAGGVRGMKILFVIEDHDLWRLDGLEKLTGHIGGGGMRLHLERMDEARVADAVERTVLGGGAYFESGLSQQIALDLCKGGPVSPSELQLVAGTAVNLRLNTAKAWRRSGGAEVLSWRFFEKACLAAGGRPAARALAEIAALPERGVATLDQIARAADVPETNAKKLVDDLRAEHLVRAVDGGWTMASEWARPLVRAYTGEARGRGVAARLVMREKIEANALLSIGQVREVERYAGALAPEEEALVRRSRQVGWAVTGALLGGAGVRACSRSTRATGATTSSMRPPTPAQRWWCGWGGRRWRSAFCRIARASARSSPTRASHARRWPAACRRAPGRAPATIGCGGSSVRSSRCRGP